MNDLPSSPLYPAEQSNNKANKKRKIDRACDACRRRKTKCDGPTVLGNVCTNCLQSRKECTYVEISKRRGPPKAYITELEERLRKMEDWLKRLCPDSDFSDELGPRVVIGSWRDDPPEQHGQDPQQQLSPNKSLASPFSTRTLLGFSTHLMFTPKRSRGSSDSDKHTDSQSDDDLIEVIEGQQTYNLKTFASENVSEFHKINNRWHGPSTSMRMMDLTRKSKRLHLAETYDGWEKTSLPTGESECLRRLEYWVPPKWESMYEGLYLSCSQVIPEALAAFPSPDLCKMLIDLYFDHVNIYYPLLHRSTFERQWRDKLYERNIWFTFLSLAVLSTAAPASDDMRVLPKDSPKQETGDIDWSTAGWDYFNAAMSMVRLRASLFYPATLYEVQGLTLLSLFLFRSDHHVIAWHTTLLGLRKAQDVGAHRKAVYQQQPNVVEEQWKRCFWILLSFDRSEAVTLGRPCSIAEEDYDVDFPLEVDDEFWEPEDRLQAFRQPADIPSRMTGFNLWLKLTQIIGFTLRTLYATHTDKVIMGRPIGKPEQIVSHINAALTEWIESVPVAFRWSTDMRDTLRMKISATLYATYYMTQILIYRPFIPAPTSTASTYPFPALAICTNAARSAARIVEEELKHDDSNLPNLIVVSLFSAGILLVHVWELKLKETKLGHGVDEKSRIVPQIMRDIRIFVRALELASVRHAIVRQPLEDLKQAMPSDEDVPDPSATDPPPASRTEMEPPPQVLVWNSGPGIPSLGLPSHYPNSSIPHILSSSGHDTNTPILPSPFDQSIHGTPQDSPRIVPSLTRYECRYCQPTSSTYPDSDPDPKWTSHAQRRMPPHSSPAYTGKADLALPDGKRGQFSSNFQLQTMPSEEEDTKLPVQNHSSSNRARPPVSNARSLPHEPALFPPPKVQRPHSLRYNPAPAEEDGLRSSWGRQGHHHALDTYGYVNGSDEYREAGYAGWEEHHDQEQGYSHGRPLQRSSTYHDYTSSSSHISPRNL